MFLLLLPINCPVLLSALLHAHLVGLIHFRKIASVFTLHMQSSSQPHSSYIFTRLIFCCILNVIRSLQQLFIQFCSAFSSLLANKVVVSLKTSELSRTSYTSVMALKVTVVLKLRLRIMSEGFPCSATDVQMQSDWNTTLLGCPY